MNIEELLFFIIITITIIIYILHNLLKKSNNKIANFINKIWDEWFEEQWKAILAFIIFMIVICIIGLAFR